MWKATPHKLHKQCKYSQQLSRFRLPLGVITGVKEYQYSTLVMLQTENYKMQSKYEAWP